MIRIPGFRSGRAFGVLAVLAGIAGCGATPKALLDQHLSDGRVVADLVEPDVPSAVLVFPPSACFRCAGSLGEWAVIDSTGRIRVKLVLSEAPSEAESRLLILQRIQYHGVVAGGRSVGIRAPSEYLVIDGVVRHSAVGEWSGAGSLSSPVLRKAKELGQSR